MLNKTLKRALVGIPIGVGMSFTLTLISWVLFYSDSFLSLEVFTRYFVAGALIGAIQAGATVIWEIDEWSLHKQLALFGSLIVISFFSAVSIGQYFELTVFNVSLYLGGFGLLYVILIIINYFHNKSWVHSINQKLD